ncbi:MAG: hypothetical protein KKD28_08110 [Chloroflexi bacterium]|nr:hypothetical protein [Chloroflexota bacterium]MBU1661423.1 hypothetical protein [Chloroflexota bacterium]
METAQRISKRKIADRLHALAQLYQTDQASELMERTLDKLLSHEAGVCQSQFDQIHTDLNHFEQQYSLPSDEFYLRYQAGKTDDHMDLPFGHDVVEWASLAQMAENLKARLRVLTGGEVHN